jgi:Tripartite tricarboxylate transporter TctB family
MEHGVNIKSQKDFFSGLMFLIVGLGFAIGAYSYGMGDGARMGPGYFPRLLGVIMAVLGSVIVFKALTVATADGEKVGKWAWKPLAYVLGANLAFGVLLGGLPSIKLPSMGMIAGIYALTIIASFADGKVKMKEVLILATILAVGSYLAFIMLLKLQIPVWPTFLS